MARINIQPQGETEFKVGDEVRVVTGKFTGQIAKVMIVTERKDYRRYDQGTLKYGDPYVAYGVYFDGQTSGAKKYYRASALELFEVSLEEIETARAAVLADYRELLALESDDE